MFPLHGWQLSAPSPYPQKQQPPRSGNVWLPQVVQGQSLNGTYCCCLHGPQVRLGCKQHCCCSWRLLEKVATAAFAETRQLSINQQLLWFLLLSSWALAALNDWWPLKETPLLLLPVVESAATIMLRATLLQSQQLQTQALGGVTSAVTASDYQHMTIHSTADILQVSSVTWGRSISLGHDTWSRLMWLSSLWFVAGGCAVWQAINQPSSDFPQTSPRVFSPVHCPSLYHGCCSLGPSKVSSK
jgi:hypothetical protein